MNPSRLLLALPVLLAACDAIPEDSKFVQGRYLGHHGAPCPSWVTSTVSGRVYCSSPHRPYDTTPAYVAARPVVNDSAFVGFDTKSPEDQKALLVAEGEKVYANNCVACHQALGTGMAGNFPPLANDPLVTTGTPEEHVAIILKGLSGKEIGGVVYPGAMASFATLTDNQVAAVATYERSSWGNAASVILPAQVAAVRAAR